MIDEIKEELLELRFDINSIGIVYWIEAISIIHENPKRWSMMDIYHDIAQKHQSTYTRVERAMRHCIEPAKKKIQEKYNYYNEIKNQTFLNLIRYKLL